MSNNLSAFLAQNAIKVENEKYVASKRFIGENKKPIEWEICCITSDEDIALRKNCTRKVQVPGKKNQFTNETDYDKYLTKLAVKCVVYPNLNDADLQNSYGVMGAEQLVTTMLTPGEYNDLLEKIQAVNGFEVTFDDKVEEAKN